MNKKIVLVVDEKIERAERLVFIIRLGGYEARIFNHEATALNWAKYGCGDGDALAVVVNQPMEIDRAEEILENWSVSGMPLPVVLLQRQRSDWNRLLTIRDHEYFFICEPESIMQTLEILATIKATAPESGNEQNSPLMEVGQ